MNGMMAIPALIQGLVAAIVALVVVAVSAAVQGRAGVTFAELLTAGAVGLAVGLVTFLMPKVIEWQIRRHGGEPSAMHMVASSGSWGGEPHASAESGHRPRDRFDRFTDGARRALTLAQDEAQRFHHNSIGTEHLLLGLVRERDGVAARVLENMNVELAKVRTAVEFIIGRGDRPVVGEVGLTPGAKRVIELAIDEARGLGHRDIGTEHLLLGLIQEGEGIAAGVLESLGVNLERTRSAVLQALAGGTTEA